MGANRRCLAYLTVCAVLVALSTALVAFRVLLRWKRSVLGLDDYVICGSIVLAYGMFGEAVVCTSPIATPPAVTDHSVGARDGGLGKHVVDLTMAEQIIFQKASRYPHSMSLQTPSHRRSVSSPTKSP
ncbi:hypothetical protein BDV28DRAFT_138933 [Aspergillus coremiiformis]|uniref:Uncharacterized protein n=1 Tax=Aspergillus coremiiformis TaxID=138285 RepID=A0A5N6Z3J3_9EURO|nr:hypothetical protein BDV28DRAFT_138933 [Aspergillus coremiiformis]